MADTKAKKEIRLKRGLRLPVASISLLITNLSHPTFPSAAARNVGFATPKVADCVNMVSGRSVKWPHREALSRYSSGSKLTLCPVQKIVTTVILFDSRVGRFPGTLHSLFRPHPKPILNMANGTVVGIAVGGWR